MSKAGPLRVVFMESNKYNIHSSSCVTSEGIIAETLSTNSAKYVLFPSNDSNSLTFYGKTSLFSFIAPMLADILILLNHFDKSSNSFINSILYLLGLTFTVYDLQISTCCFQKFLFPPVHL